MKKFPAWSSVQLENCVFLKMAEQNGVLTKCRWNNSRTWARTRWVLLIVDSKYVTEVRLYGVVLR